MKENKYNQNQVVYFVRGLSIFKGVISEIFLHYKVNETIIKYSIRPYGLDKFVDGIEEKDIYLDLEKLKSEMIDNLKKAYTKEQILEEKKKELEMINKKRDEQLKNFDRDLENFVTAIRNTQDKFFNKKEKKYQNSIKKEKKQ